MLVAYFLLDEAVLVQLEVVLALADFAVIAACLLETAEVAMRVFGAVLIVYVLVVLEHRQTQADFIWFSY